VITQCHNPCVQRHSSALRRESLSPVASHQSTLSQPVQEARPVDLASLRLVLRQHLEELRLRGVPESVLRPIEDELRRYSPTIDDLTRWTQP
jgi:hypothetical protein